MKQFVILTLLTFASSGVFAKIPLKGLLTKADSLLQKIYYSGNYDSAYVCHSEGKMGLKLWGNLSGSSLRAYGPDVSARLSTDNRKTLSLELDYYDLSLEMAVNPASLSGRNKDMEFNFNFFGSWYNVNVNYQMANTATGNITYHGVKTDVERDWLHTRMLNLSFYYTFNYRRFSYNAPFYQLFIQKRSAGSWLAGISYQGGSISTNSNIPAGIPDSRFHAQHIGIGGGYAYNLVAGKKWLFHLSVVPSVIVWKGNKIEVNGKEIDNDTRSLPLLVDGKISAVYFFSPRRFMGLNGMINGLAKRKSDTEIIEDKWLFRVFYGMRL